MQLATTALTTVSHLADSGTSYVAAIDNPINGLVPDFNVFGAEFTTWWQKLFAGLWAAGLIVSIAFLIFGILDLRRATANHVPGQADEAKTKVGWSAAAVGGLAGLGVIVTAIFTVFG